MNLDSQTIQNLALLLETCQLEQRETEKVTNTHPDMDWEDAYAIQDELLRRKLARGARIAGLKCGLTSHAKMKQMGVTDPVFGFLVDDYIVAEGGEVDTRQLIHPKAEAEICFVLKHALRGPGCHIGSVLAATDFVIPGIEVIDSRYRDFKFDLKSVVADNTSASRFAIGGRPMRVAGLDLSTLGVVMEKNGEIVGVGAGAAVLGHPAAAVAMLANHLGRRGQEIPAGSLILSGGITEAVTMQAGDRVQVRIHDLGSVSMRFV
jgi:2-oxo-3-hexenedioate decarboxylase